MTDTPAEALKAGELLPCPFCDGRRGELAVSSWLIGTKQELLTAVDQYGHQVRCICGAQGPESGDEAEAIAAWNTRPATDAGEVREKVARIIDPVAWTAHAKQVRYVEEITDPEARRWRQDIADSLVKSSLAKATAILAISPGWREG